MTNERKMELGNRIKEIGVELQAIAKEWRETNGDITSVTVEVSGTCNIDFDNDYGIAYLHEKYADGSHRMVTTAEYEDNDDNRLEKLFMYDRNDMVDKEDKSDGEENAEE